MVYGMEIEREPDSTACFIKVDGSLGGKAAAA